jgi:hypothetical protein
MTAYAFDNLLWRIYYNGEDFNGSTQQMRFSLNGAYVLALEYQSNRASGAFKTISIEHNVTGGRKYTYTLLTDAPEGLIELGGSQAPATPGPGLAQPYSGPYP